jgi:hypothetical protein
MIYRAKWTVNEVRVMPNIHSSTLQYLSCPLLMRVTAALRSSILIAVTVLVSALFVLRDARDPEILYGDAIGYYMYLPSSFIYHNTVNFYELPADRVTESSVLWQMNNLQHEGYRTPKGYVINQYTYGVALMEAPFFFIAHGLTLLAGGSANGFSMPYVLALRIGNALYALLGLLLIYRILRRYFNSDISLLTTLGIFLGSNLFWFTLRQAGMSHIPLFFLYALLIWCSIRLYEHPRVRRFLGIGVIAGLITLIRPTDVLCLIIPLCYGITSRETLWQRVLFLRRHWKALVCAALVFALPVIPQMFYWKAASGQWMFYSYGQQGFDWTHPHIFRGLCGGSNGWLAFSPLMAFSLIGILCWRRIKVWMLCILLLLPLYIYVTYAWYCFNYINGLGSRPMIHVYPLLALPFAALLQWVASRSIAVKSSAAAVALLLIAVNLSFSSLQARRLLNSEDSNWDYNLDMLFRSRLCYRDLVEKDIAVRQPKPGSLQFVRTLACEGFDDSLDKSYVRDTVAGRRGYFVKIHEEEYSPVSLKVAWSQASFGNAAWIRCSGRFMYPANVGLYENHLLFFDVRRGGELPIWKGLRIENKVGLADSSCQHWAHGNYDLGHEEHTHWGSVWFYVKLPVGKMKDGDTLELNVWNPAHHELNLDELKMELWQ